MNWMKIYKDKKTMLILFLAVILGILFMLYHTPVKSAESVKAVSNENISTEKKLEDILSDVKGAGRVRVMINYKGGSEKIVAYNSDKESENKHDGYKINEKNEMAFSKDEPVVIKEIYPEIEGVLIVAEGGGNNQVKNNLIKATMALLGVEMNKIEVLVMKKEA